MSARDVINAVTYFENDNMGMSNETTIGETFGADAILSALRCAGWAVVPVEPTKAMKRAWTKAAPMSNAALLVRYAALIKTAQEDSRE